jgi:hypothetical protein
MNKQFDELTKGLARSVTRRGALKKFSLALAGMALACFGMANKAEAGQQCTAHVNCPIDNPHCCDFKKCTTYTCPTDPYWAIDASYCSFYCPPKGIH